MGVRYKDWTKLQDKINKLAKEDAEKFIRSTAKELAARLLAKVIKRTPVGHKLVLEDKKTIKVTGKYGKKLTFLSKEGAILQQYWSGYRGGELRRGWTAGKNIPVYEYVKTIPIAKIGGMVRVTIVNSVHYASYVEFGHRQTPGRYVPQLGKRLKFRFVKGKFMLRESELEMMRDTPAIVEQRLNKFLKETFK